MTINQDKRMTFDMHGVIIAVCTGGDNKEIIQPDFNAYRPILFCPSCSYALKTFEWVLQIFFGRRIGELYAVTLEGGGVVTEDAV